MNRQEALHDLEHLISLATELAIAGGSSRAACVEQARTDLIALGVSLDELDAAGISVAVGRWAVGRWAVVRYDGFVIAHSFPNEDEAVAHRSKLFTDDPQTWIGTTVFVAELEA